MAYAPGYRAQSPLAAAAQNLIGAFARMPGPNEIALQQAKAAGLYAGADAQSATAALNRAKLVNENAQAAAPGSLAKAAEFAYGPLRESPRALPDEIGPMPANTREQQVQQALPQVFSAAVQTGKPDQLGEIVRAFIANAPGITDTSVIDRAGLGSGDHYQNTIGGTREKLEADRKNEQFKVLNTPHSVGPGGILASAAKPFIAGAPGTKSQEEAKILRGMTPEEQKATMLKKGIRIQNPDGTTIEIGGSGDLAKPTVANLEKSQIALEDFQRTLGSLREASKDPTVFGTTGNIRRLWSGVVEQGRNLAHLTGDPQAADKRLNGLAEQMTQAGFDPRLIGVGLDPNLWNVETLANLAVFQAAGALANQEGRSISDKDVKHFKGIVGDPASWVSSQPRFLAGLDLMDKEVNTRVNAVRQTRRQGLPTAPMAAPAAAPPGPMPTTAPAQPNVIRYDAQGNRVQ